MPRFSKKSLTKLQTCDERLQKLCNAVIQEYDFTVIYGHRTPEEQFEIFQEGREIIDGEWVVVNRGKIKTEKDGYKKLSKHNYTPSLAVDIAPYFNEKPNVRFNDINSFIELADIFKAKASQLGIKIRWGGDWKDYGHFEIVD